MNTKYAWLAGIKDVKIFKTDNREKKPVYRVRVQDRKHCLILINSLLPYLISKKPQAKLLKLFLQSSKDKSESQAALIRNINKSSS